MYMKFILLIDPIVKCILLQRLHSKQCNFSFYFIYLFYFYLEIISGSSAQCLASPQRIPALTLGTPAAEYPLSDHADF